MFRNLLEPYPALYRLPPLFVFFLGLTGLYGVIQFFRIAIEGKEFMPYSMAAGIGDPALAVYMGVAALILRDYYEEERFYETAWWYLTWVMVGFGFGIHRKVVYGVFTPLEITHDFVLMPVFTGLVIGVIPAICQTRGHYFAKATALACLAVYIATSIRDFA